MAQRSESWQEAYEIVKAKFAEVKDRLKGLHGAAQFVLALPFVIKAVEATAIEVGGLSGAEKKELVVNILDDLIKAGILEPVDGPIIGAAIDSLIKFWNTRFPDHKWFGQPDLLELV